MITSSLGPSSSGSLTIQGKAFGGEQPINGAQIQLLAAGTLGTGSKATNLLTAPVHTDANGGFNISGKYSCPAGSQVYLLATGGSAGLSISNPNLSLISALGSCSTLLANAATTYIEINELTTVGAVYALSPFMTSASNVGASSSNSNLLALAFGDASLLANSARGSVPGPTLPAGATVPTTEMNTLADILATCINSAGGSAGDSTTCGQLFTAATPSNGVAPTETVTALVNIAQHPGANVATLFNLVSPSSPFQPTLGTVPTDWTLAVTYTAAGLSSPSAVAIDAAGDVWIANKAGSVAELSHSGDVLKTGLVASNGPSALAIDVNGGAWITNQSSNTLSHVGSTGVSLGSAASGGLNLPAAIAIDPQGNVWVANSGSNTISEFSSTGSAVISSGYANSGISKPLGIAISAH